MEDIHFLFFFFPFMKGVFSCLCCMDDDNPLSLSLDSHVVCVSIFFVGIYNTMFLLTTFIDLSNRVCWDGMG